VVFVLALQFWPWRFSKTDISKPDSRTRACGLKLNAVDTYNIQRFDKGHVSANLRRL
jgi:hypothetical protein